MDYIYLIDLLGFHVPLLLFVIACFFLWSKPVYLITYFIGFFINIGINSFSKAFIQEPRPSEDKNIFYPAKTHLKRYSFDNYGMPSGHAQTSFYCLVFIWLTLKNVKIITLYLLLSGLTLYQRYKYKEHTMLQLIIGSILGGIMGYIFFKIAIHNKKGKVINKPDDFYI